MSFGNRIPGFRKGCPDSNRLAAFVDRALEEADRSALRKHIARCDACFETVSQLTLLREQPLADLPAWIANGAKSLADRSLPARQSSSLKLAGSLATVVLLVGAAIAFWSDSRSSFNSEIERSVRGSGDREIQVSFSHPRAGATVKPDELEFSWNEIADAIAYRVQVTDLEGSLVWEARQSGSTSMRPPESAIPEGDYFASVQVTLRDGRVIRGEFLRFFVRRPNAP